MKKILGTSFSRPIKEPKGHVQSIRWGIRYFVLPWKGIHEKVLHSTLRKSRKVYIKGVEITMRQIK